MHKKILSVIVPMYNAQKTIRTCLDSLLVQESCRKYLEVVIVDDGSTDRSAAYAWDYVVRYPDIFQLLRKQNGGHGSAVNLGTGHCRGVYFKVLDADDWLHTKQLEQVLKLLSRMEAQVVVCGYDRYQIRNGAVTQIRAVRKKARERPAVQAAKGAVRFSDMGQAVERVVRFLDMEQLIREWGRYRQLFCMHGIIYRTDFYQKLCYQMPEKVSYDDALFFTSPCSHADRLCILDLQLYVYRVGDESQSVSAKNRVARIRQHEAVIHAMLDTEGRNCEKTKAGREYWYRKLVSVVTDYYVTVFLRFCNKKKGRRYGKRFTEQLKERNNRIYQRIKNRYRLLWAMSICNMKYLKKYEDEFVSYYGRGSQLILVKKERKDNEQ